jgi:hypothetical protein
VTAISIKSIFTPPRGVKAIKKCWAGAI